MDSSDAADASLEAFTKDIKPLGLLDIMPLVAGLRVDFHENGGNRLLVGHEYRLTEPNGTINGAVGDRMPNVPTKTDRAFLYWHTCPQGVNNCDGVDCYDLGRPNADTPVLPIPSTNCGVAGRFSGRFLGTTVINSNMIVYAQWGVTMGISGNGITLPVLNPANPNDPNCASARSLRVGFSIDETLGMEWPAEPSRVGFTFEGWYDGDHRLRGDLQNFNRMYPDTPIYSSIVIHPRWAFLGMNMVTFDPTEGAFDESHDDWSRYRLTRVGLGIAPSFDYPHYLNQHASWTNWDVDGLPPGFTPDMSIPEQGRIPTVVHRGGTYPAMVSNTVVPGDRSLRGWNTEANGSGDPFTMTTVVEDDMTVYAQWNATVRFNPNGGSFNGTQVPSTTSDERDPNNVWQLGPRTVAAGTSVQDTPGIVWPDGTTRGPFNAGNSVFRNTFQFLGWYAPCPDRPAGMTGAQAVPIEEISQLQELPYATRVDRDTPIYENVTLYARWARLLSINFRWNETETSNTNWTTWNSSLPPGGNFAQFNWTGSWPTPQVMNTTYNPGQVNQRAGFEFRGWTNVRQLTLPLRLDNPPNYHPEWAQRQPVLAPVNPDAYNTRFQPQTSTAFWNGLTTGAHGSPTPRYFTANTPIHASTLAANPANTNGLAQLYAHWVRRAPAVVTFVDPDPSAPNGGFRDNADLALASNTTWFNQRLIAPDTSLPSSSNSLTHFLNQDHAQNLEGGMFPPDFDRATYEVMHYHAQGPAVVPREGLTFSGWWRGYDRTGALFTSTTAQVPGSVVQSIGTGTAISNWTRHQRIAIAQGDFYAYPSWVRRVTFDANGGHHGGTVAENQFRDIRESAPANATVRSHGMAQHLNTVAAVPAIAMRPAHEFQGWWSVQFLVDETDQEAAERFAVIWDVSVAEALERIYEFTMDCYVPESRTVWARYDSINVATVTFVVQNVMGTTPVSWATCPVPNNVLPNTATGTSRLRVVPVGQTINETEGVTMPNNVDNVNNDHIIIPSQLTPGNVANAHHLPGSGHRFYGWYTHQILPGETLQDAADRLNIPVTDIQHYYGNRVIQGAVTLQRAQRVTSQ